MSVIAPHATASSPIRLEVRREALFVEGHALEDVVLAGYAHGAPLGSGPVFVVVGGITASPYPFATEDAWWPALHAPDLIDLEQHTVLTLSWPGNGSTWRGIDDGSLPPLSALGLADLLA